MDILSLTISIITILLLFLGIVYLIFFLPKSQEKTLKLHLGNQQKEASKFEEKNEEIKNSALELKEKIEEISQKLRTNEEIAKVLLENVDKSIKGEIVNQQKLFQEKNKELSEKLNKDLELCLNNNQQLIKTHLENLNKGISQPLEKLNSVLLHSGKRGI